MTPKTWGDFRAGDVFAGPGTNKEVFMLIHSDECPEHWGVFVLVSETGAGPGYREAWLHKQGRVVGSYVVYRGGSVLSTS